MLKTRQTSPKTHSYGLVIIYRPGWGRGKGKGKGGFGTGGFFGDHMVFMKKKGKCHLLPTEYKGRTIEN